MASALAPHLPYLRRYARALTGSQDSGDSYVVATLETLVADPSTFPTGMSHKIGLFHVFLRIWGSLDVNAQSDQSGNTTTGSAADSNLEQITPRARKAFLLVALEEFSIADAAQILGVDERTTRTLVDQASREIARQVATDVLIIEDEPLIAMDLEDVVTSLNHRLIGIARTRKEALELVAKTQPGLVLADIQLADGSSGLAAVNDMLQAFEVPVIFITAYPERLLTGERPEPTFLITKPFQPSTVKAVMSQALFFNQAASAAKSG